MSKLEQVSYDWLMDENPIDLFKLLEYLNSVGIYPSAREKDQLARVIDDILTELELVRSLKLLWDTKRYNRLVYGY